MYVRRHLSRFAVDRFEAVLAGCAQSRWMESFLASASTSVAAAGST